MKYLATLFLLLGIFVLVFGFRMREVPKPAPGTDPEGGWALAVMEKRLHEIIVGVAAVLFGVYLFSRSLRSHSSAHSCASLVVMRPRICPKCGRPSRKGECARGKQFGFIPRRKCPDCGSFVEQSGIRIMALGFVLLISGFIGGFEIDHAPDLLLESACIGMLLGVIWFLLGAFVTDRQLKLVKRYVSERGKAPLA